MISIAFTSDDLVNLRFAINPLWVIILGARAQFYPERYPEYYEWRAKANAILGDMHFPYLRSIPLDMTTIPDFLTPIPETDHPDVETLLARVATIPADMVMTDIAEIRERGIDAESLCLYERNPREALECLAEELWLYWERVIKPEWSQIQSVLEGDLIYRAHQLALGGAEELFISLNSRIVSYQHGKVMINTRSKDEVTLDGAGIIMMPTIFTGGVWVQWRNQKRVALTYGAYGAGRWRSVSPQPSKSLKVTIGASKAQILTNLIQPKSTSQLAHDLHLTPGAISQHLSQLKQAGLIDSQRVGKHVYYMLNKRGKELLHVFNAY